MANDKGKERDAQKLEEAEKEKERAAGRDSAADALATRIDLTGRAGD